MYKKTRRQLSNGGLLFATLIEFMKCWGSGMRSRLFVESVNGEAFLNFSTFLGSPGRRDHFKQNKMASGEETQGFPESFQDPIPNKKSNRKKSKKKTERDNQRAAEFQKKKQEELTASIATSKNSIPLVAAAATSKSSNPSVAATTPEGSPPTTASSSTPIKEFRFSEPSRENMSSLDCSDSTLSIMNLDGNMTLSETSEDVKEASSDTQKLSELVQSSKEETL